MKTLESDIYKSPIGEILIIGDKDQLVLMDFNDCQDRIAKLLKRRFGQYSLLKNPNLLGMQDKLDAYFNKDWESFNRVSLETKGTEFQQTVWQELQRIPIGTTYSYDKLANEIRNPKAVRAVASANANNPIAIIIPCHRVIGKNGSMRGYAGGIDRKVWLLRHEGAII